MSQAHLSSTPMYLPRALSLTLSHPLSLSLHPHRAVGTQVGDVSGLISTRTWVLIIYAALLHLAVMISYTKRHDLRTVCGEYASEQANSFLPDHLPRHGGLP
uniref:Uncharacterized protein n=1 Tax=Tetraselmis chuii TaxID=63592 RepID=A0A7S1SIH9_9CHLO|mmetsp:Transcript_12793/g.22853  ORF Transcript_12793/g.22853 Transcript_12793/m.22853 type:complete len:102 (+) Transcript_12793:185-490(+)